MTDGTLSDVLPDMKKITARDFARNQAKAVNGLRAHKRRKARAADMIKDLHKLPMSDADGDQILREFAGEALF